MALAGNATREISLIQIHRQINFLTARLRNLCCVLFSTNDGLFGETLLYFPTKY